MCLPDDLALPSVLVAAGTVCILASAVAQPPCDPVVPPCPGTLPYTVTADPAAPPELRAAAIYATVRWNRELGQQAFVWVTRPPAYITVREIGALPPAWLARWEREGTGPCTCGGAVEVLPRDHCPARLRRIIMHELGHALGLTHEDAPDLVSVMQHISPDCPDDLHEEISPALVKRALELLQQPTTGDVDAP